MEKNLFIDKVDEKKALQWSLNYIDGILLNQEGTKTGTLVQARSLKRRTHITFYLIQEGEGFWYSKVSERPLVLTRTERDLF